MTEDEDDQRTTWVPFAIAGGLVAIILAVVLSVDGASDDKRPASPGTPTSSTSP
ncbi:MAG: hypothetical protein NTV23_10795 [Propionibacteriales bacterium]|nr:hypothetical protein [Propionibacteriales bacterium]